jgi:flagellar biosynthesis protein FlhA
LASGVIVALAMIPGLPKIPFLMLGAGLGTAGWRKHQQSQAVEKIEAAAPAPARDNLEVLLRVEPLAIEVGLGLVKLVEGGQNSPLLRRIAGIRRQLAGDLGYLLPPVRVTDNLSLRAREYSVLLKSIEIARYELPQGCDLAIPVGKKDPTIEGQPTKEPAFGMAATWIPSEQAERARRAGYTVVDAVSVMGTHLSEIIRQHAHELFSRQDTKRMLDRVSADQPKIVEDLVPKLLPLAAVQRVLQNLLRERVSIRDAASILEGLGEAAGTTRNPVLLTEYVRQSIRRTVVKPYLNAAGDLQAYFFDHSLEQAVEAAVDHGEQNSQLGMAPQAIREILNRVARVVGAPEAPVVAITTSGARYFLRQIVESSMRNLVLISHNEVPAEVKVVSLGVIG